MASSFPRLALLRAKRVPAVFPQRVGDTQNLIRDRGIICEWGKD